MTDDCMPDLSEYMEAAEVEKVEEVEEVEEVEAAKARIKAGEKRSAVAAAKRKQREIDLAEKKKHIRARKARALQSDAEIAVFAEDEVMKRETDLWDEEKLVGLMNRTLDTYFVKRKEEKEKRATIPVDPSVYSNYQPGLPPKRAVPKKVAPRSTYRNPYAAQFGLSIEDEDLYGLH